MIGYLRGMVPEALWPFVFAVVFLAIGGGALYLTPRIAKWVAEHRKQHPGYYDGMLEEDPAMDEEKREEEEQPCSK